MKKILLVTLCFINLILVAQHASNTSYKFGKLTNTRIDSTDLPFSFPCIAFNSEYGIEECFYNEIFVTQSNGDSIAKYDHSGNLIETFTIPGVSNIRDLTCDGDLFWGGTNDTILYAMDFYTKKLIAKVNMPMVIQSIAYQEWDLSFYVSEENSSLVYYTDINGAILGFFNVEGTSDINISGMTIATDSWHEPYLWVFCQDSSNSLLRKYDNVGEQIGYDIDLSSLVSENAKSGGLCYYGNYDNGYLCCLFQDELVFAIDRHYANLLVSNNDNLLITKFDLYPNPASEKVVVTSYNTQNQKIMCKVFNQSGKIMYENQISSNLFEIDIQNYSTGIYFMQLTSEEGYALTKKFQKL